MEKRRAALRGREVERARELLVLSRQMEVAHPAASMLSLAAQMQDQEYGDGTNLVGELLTLTSTEPTPTPQPLPFASLCFTPPIVCVLLPLLC